MKNPSCPSLSFSFRRSNPTWCVCICLSLTLSFIAVPCTSAFVPSHHPPTILSTRSLWENEWLLYSTKPRFEESENTNRQRPTNRNKGRHYKSYKNNKRNTSNTTANLPFHRELRGLTRKRHPDAAKWAHQRLDQALNYEPSRTESDSDNHNRQQQQPQVDEICFNICIMGYAKQSERGNDMAPVQAEALLRQMEETDKTTNFVHVKPSAFTYNAVMEAWSKRAPSSTLAQDAVLRLFHELGRHATLMPNTYSYNLVLALYAFDSTAENALERLDELYEEMQQNTNTQPDRRTIGVVLSAFARHGQAEKAQAVLESAWRRYRNGQSDLKPNQVWMNCVINAWSKSNSTDAGQRADDLLHRMQSLYEWGQSSVRPDTTSYNSCMNCHAQLGNSTRVEELLTELEHRYTLTGEADLEPDTITYSTLIKAYANRPFQTRDEQYEAVEQALAVLDRMERFNAAGRTKMAPNLVTYNTVIKICAQLGTREGLDRGMQLLRRLKNHKTLNPDSMSYAELILGWKQSGLRDGGSRAEQLLFAMEKLPESRKRGLNLTLMYNAVIAAWAKSLDRLVAPRRVEVLLDLLCQKFLGGDKSACPDTTTFLSVSDAYAKSQIPNAYERCQALLKCMDQLVEAGAPYSYQNRKLWNSFLNAYAKSEQPGIAKKAEQLLSQMENSQDDDCRPDIVTYSALISCYTKSGEPPDRAEELLHYVEESYRLGNERLCPNAVFYSTIQQAWSKSASREGADKAERLLRRNELLFKQGGHDHCRPHAIVYNAVMDAIARTAKDGDKCCGRRAEALLVEMQDMSKSGLYGNDMKPSRRSFSAVMLAYRHDGDANKAEELLHRMEHLAEDGVYDVHPCVVDYNCAIGALADADDLPDAADRAQALLDRMVELHRHGKHNNWSTRPDEITYCGVIKAWLKRHDEKGSAMVHAMLQDFKNLVEETKATLGESLPTAPVYNVIDAYGGEQAHGGMQLDKGEAESVQGVLEAMKSEMDDIDWSEAGF